MVANTIFLYNGHEYIRRGSKLPKFFAVLRLYRRLGGGEAERDRREQT